MKHLAFALTVLLACCLLRGEGSFQFDEKGVLHIGNSEWGALFQDENYKPSSQTNRFVVEESDQGAGFWRGQFSSSNGLSLFQYSLQAKTLAPIELAVEALVIPEHPVEAKALMYDGQLPASEFAGSEIIIDGQSLVLPENTSESHVLMIKQARKVVLPIDGTLTIEGKFLVMVVDNRKFGGSHFSVRLGFDPHKGLIQKSRFKAQIHHTPIALQKVSLASVTNRNFSDDVAGDGKGGWTDQGQDNDLRAFKRDSELSSAMDFSVNFDGPGALILSKNPDRSDSVSAMIDLPNGELEPAYLHLLHASAYTWGKVGLIKVIYADGDEELIEVNAKEDVGNWWNPTFLPNAAVVWSGKSKDANVGLYESRFALQNKRVSQLGFASNGDPTWMIVGATLTEADVPLPKPQSYTIQAGKNWAPIKQPMTIEAGSALDFSEWTEAPAGQHGHVITTKEGHFAFENEPEVPVRFWGTNINFDVNFMNKKESKALAKRFRQMGYNAVRIHHYDVLLTGGWNPEGYKIDPEMLDRLDYLFACMKEEGLYISTDLFTIRRIHEPAVKAIDSNNAGAFKALIPIMPEAMADWKRFAHDLLSHQNPYTGMSWAEDPALFSICPVNEDTIWAALNANKQVRELWNEKFEEWLVNQSNSPKTEADRAAAFNRFLAEKQMESDNEMRRFLREDLHCKALLTGNNWKMFRSQTPIRAQYDYIDNHGYWDHPNFPTRPWKYPFSHSQRSATQDRAEIPRRLFLSRIDGRPFTVTEFNYVYPNQYRSEGGALAGAYASLQDWDGMFRFSWAHKLPVAVEPHVAEGFDIAADPINLLSEHIIGMFWRRGDMPHYSEEAIYVVGDKEAYAGDRVGQTPRKFPDNANLLGLTKRVSTQYDPKVVEGHINQEFTEEKPRSRYESEIGKARVILEVRGDFLAETEQSKAIVIQSQSLDEAFVKDVSGGSVTCFIGAIDDQPLAESERLLILHLTNVLSSNIAFGEKGMHTILDPGELPLLVRRGGATIRVPHTDDKPVSLYALDLSGARVAKIPFQKLDDAIEFRAETIAADGRTTLAYELVVD